MQKYGVLILGGGLAGLSAAYHLENAGFKDYLLLEKEDEIGGICKSKLIRGYTFDYGPHIFYTSNDYVFNLITGFLGENLIRKERKAYIFLNGDYIKYPFEVNLHDISDKRIVRECLLGAMRRRENSDPSNFEDWIVSTFGEGIAKYYMIPYNRKVWKYDLRVMSIDWIKGRVPAPSIEDMVDGALGICEKEFGGNAIFYYPKVGGIGALPNAFYGRVSNVATGCEVKEIVPNGDSIEVSFYKDGKLKRVRCKKIISSIPLPRLFKMIKDVPENLLRLSEKLVYTSMICVNIGVKRENISDKHWLYFPENKYVFNRISFPMNFSPFTTPPRRSSILTETTHIKGEKAHLEGIKEKVLDGLIEADILKGDDELEVVDATRFEFAYVVYDRDHRRKVRELHEYLLSKGIHPVGRFGLWEYLNMDKTILSGRKVVEEVFTR